jgi:hypothetical protein
MLPVLLHVAHIVNEVDGGAHQAERDEGQCRTPDHGWLEEPASGQRCGEDEEVLDPLAGSRSAESGWHPAASNGNLCGLGHQDARLSIPFLIGTLTSCSDVPTPSSLAFYHIAAAASSLQAWSEQLVIVHTA